MKIVIEKDDGTKLTFEGPSALDDLRDYLGPQPLRIPYVPRPSFPPLIIGDPPPGTPWAPPAHPGELPFGTYC